jgi:hypothetical protein
MQDRPNHDELLEPLLPRLEQLGLPDLAQRLRAVLNPMHESAEPGSTTSAEMPEGGLVSAAEAAGLLDLRSPSTVLALADRGLLELSQVSDQKLISRRSKDWRRTASTRRAIPTSSSGNSSRSWIRRQWSCSFNSSSRWPRAGNCECDRRVRPAEREARSPGALRV